MVVRHVRDVCAKYRNRYGSNRRLYTQYCLLMCLEACPKCIAACDYADLARQWGAYVPHAEPVSDVRLQHQGLLFGSSLVGLGLAKCSRSDRITKNGRYFRGYTITQKGKNWLRAYEEQVAIGEL